MSTMPNGLFAKEKAKLHNETSPFLFPLIHRLFGQDCI